MRLALAAPARRLTATAALFRVTSFGRGDCSTDRRAAAACALLTFALILFDSPVFALSCFFALLSIVVVVVELLELLLVSSSQLLVEWSLMNLTKMTKATY
jgi:hypothetical protein